MHLLPTPPPSLFPPTHNNPPVSAQPNKPPSPSSPHPQSPISTTHSAPASPPPPSMSKTTSELAAKDALIQRLIDEKIAQAELIQKQRDIITQYLILDIEDFLAEAREKAEAVAAQEAFDAAANEPHRSTLSKCRYLHLGLYDNISVLKILRYQLHCLWEQWATNPYSLHASWYLVIMVLLWTWLIGSVVCGYYEAAPESGTMRLARLCRGVLGAIPPIVQFLLFLFPPLFVQF
ncbi:hypothetical protein ACJQWK_10041 [Exserohilum turcicum]